MTLKEQKAIQETEKIVESIAALRQWRTAEPTSKIDVAAWAAAVSLEELIAILPHWQGRSEHERLSYVAKIIEGCMQAPTDAH